MARSPMTVVRPRLAVKTETRYALARYTPGDGWVLDDGEDPRWMEYPVARDVLADRREEEPGTSFGLCKRTVPPDQIVDQ